MIAFHWDKIIIFSLKSTKRMLKKEKVGNVLQTWFIIIISNNN